MDHLSLESALRLSLMDTPRVRVHARSPSPGERFGGPDDLDVLVIECEQRVARLWIEDEDTVWVRLQDGGGYSYQDDVAVEAGGGTVVSLIRSFVLGRYSVSRWPTLHRSMRVHGEGIDWILQAMKGA